ncbi:MAG: pre-peptidase C-terminal domain-containing protein [Myxococcota bacterium]
MNKINILITVLSGFLLLYGCDDSSSSGSSPQIIQGGGLQQAYVGVEFSVQIVAVDSDSDNLDFSFEAPDIEDIDNRSHPPTLMSAGAKSAYFRFTPLASDVGEHHITIFVSDGSNKTSATMTINVNSSTGTNPFPVFVSPLGSGTTLDLSKHTCIDVEILVEDPDSNTVDISMSEPILEGYQLVQDSPQDFEAIFSWCPTKKQIEESERYTLNLVADDREDHLTHKRYVIILRRDLNNEDCQDDPGTPPEISHQEPEAVESVEDITVSFSASDDLGLVSAPVVYYATEPPTSETDPDPNEFIPISSSLVSGDNLSGEYQVVIPNPIIGLSPGESKTVYYFIEAEDNDDPDSSQCDHRTTLPVGGIFQFTVTYPEDSQGAELCASCASDIQCGGSNDLCVYLTGNNSHCLLDCTDDPDICPTDTYCSSEDVTSVDGNVRNQCIPDSGNCIDNSCQDDQYEENDYLDSSLPPMVSGVYTDLAMCTDSVTGMGDPDWYKIPLNDESTLALFEAVFQQSQGDIDMELHDANGNSLDYSISVTDNETIIKCLPAGDYYLNLFSWESNISALYDLEIDLLPGGCCADDFTEPEGNDYSSALPVLPGDIISDLSICADDEDWFVIDLETEDILWVEMLFDQNSYDQDLDVYLYDTDGTTVLTPCCDPDNGQSSTSDEELLYSIESTGTYYIQVIGYNNSENSYMISFDVL